MSASTRTLAVPDGLDGMRVDAGLAKLLGFSRTVVVALVEGGSVLVDGALAGKSDRLVSGAWLEVTLPEVTLPEPNRLPARVAQRVPGLRVLHEDSDVVVVDKPVGVAAHPSPGWTGLTVLDGLAAVGVGVATSGAAERQGIVHRLDVGTSGVMVVAKSEHAYAALKRGFKQRCVDKHYRALVQGHPDPSRGTIDAPIDRHPKHDWRFAVVAGGKSSVTHYEVIEAFRAASLCAVTLETGRTHQIRVHFAAVGHPCCGDLAYGGDPVLASRLGLGRQWLHASRLGFAHPSDGRWMEFTSDDPDDLRGALDVLAEAG